MVQTEEPWCHLSHAQWATLLADTDVQAPLDLSLLSTSTVT